MRISKGHKDNPLMRYKIEFNLAWSDIMFKTGMSEQGLMSFIKKSPKDMLQCRVETALILKRAFGIDLLKEIYIAQDKERRRRRDELAELRREKEKNLNK